MPRKKTPHDPAAIAHAIAEVGKGRSYRDVAAELCELGEPMSHTQVKRICDEAKAQPAPAVAAASAPPPSPAPLRERVQKQRQRAAEAAPPPADPDAPFDFEASLQAMIRAAEAEAKVHDAASNPRGAQAAMRRAAELMKVLAQSEKRKPADPDVLQFSKGEIERAFGDVSALLEKYCERPVLCSECTRLLSIKFGRGQT